MNSAAFMVLHFIKRSSHVDWFNLLSGCVSCSQLTIAIYYSCVAKAMAYQWFIIASIVAITAAQCPRSQMHNRYTKSLNGTDCSVFNYTKQCCLPDSKCTLNNSNKICHCSPDCYRSENNVECCEDIHCPNGNDIIIILLQIY